MKSGDTFVVDAQAIQEVADLLKVETAELDGKLTTGDTYGIAKSDKCEGDVIRGSRYVTDKDGELKGQKGRPRRFPRATIARLLGETADRSLNPTEETEDNSDADLAAHGADLLSADSEKAEAPVAADAEGSW